MQFLASPGVTFALNRMRAPCSVLQALKNSGEDGEGEGEVDVEDEGENEDEDYEYLNYNDKVYTTIRGIGEVGLDYAPRVSNAQAGAREVTPPPV